MGKWLLILLWCVLHPSYTAVFANDALNVVPKELSLRGVAGVVHIGTPFTLGFTPFIESVSSFNSSSPTETCDPRNSTYFYKLLMKSVKEQDYKLVKTDSFPLFHPVTGAQFLIIDIHDITIASVGDYDVLLEVSNNESFSQNIRTTNLELHAIVGSWILIPLFLTMILALATHNVITSLSLGTFICAIIASPGFELGSAFARTLDFFVLEAFIDRDHAIVIIFSLFLGGLIGLISKSGGSLGLAEFLASKAKSARMAEYFTLISGAAIFFDDYSNILVVGNTFSAVTDKFLISREKLAFIVDCNAAPIASLVPISSWTSFQASLFQGQIDAILETGKYTPEDLEKLGFESTGFLALIRGLKYMFYPILLVIFQIILIGTQLEYGPMLRAQRIARYGQHLPANLYPVSHASLKNPLLNPAIDTPRRWFNAVFPVLFLIMFVLVAIYVVGLRRIPEVYVSSVPLSLVFEYADSTVALLYAGLASSVFALLLFRFQYKMVWSPADLALIQARPDLPHPPHILLPPWGKIRKIDLLRMDQKFIPSFWACCARFSPKRFSLRQQDREMEDPVRETHFGKGDLVIPKHNLYRKTRPLLYADEAIEVWLAGMGDLIPAMVVLVLAWSIGRAMTFIGSGVYFAFVAEDNLNPELLPFLTFIASGFISFATGTSFGTMAIMYPLIGPISFSSAIDNPELYYSTLSSILAGSIFGSHCSPLSDTSALTSLATGCNLMKHVITQIPYVLTVGIISSLFGYLPIGFQAYPAFVGYIIGTFGLFIAISMIGSPSISEKGRVDALTWIHLQFHMLFNRLPFAEDHIDVHLKKIVKREELRKKKLGIQEHDKPATDYWITLKHACCDNLCRRIAKPLYNDESTSSFSDPIPTVGNSKYEEVRENIEATEEAEKN